MSAPLNWRCERLRAMQSFMGMEWTPTSWFRFAVDASWGRGRHATQEQSCEATAKALTAKRRTALSVALPSSGRERIHLAGEKGRRAEDYHHRDADGKAMDSARPVGRAVGRRAENSLEEDAPEPGRSSLHRR